MSTHIAPPLPHHRSTTTALALLGAGLLGALPAFAATITVNSNLDTTGNPAICTLRDAMEAANTNAAVGGCAAGAAGADTIAFNIPGAGVHTIVLSAALPIISETVAIDGFTQPGSSPNTINTNGLTAAPINASPMVEVDGNGMSGVAGLFYVNTPATGTSIRGLAVGNHPGIAAFVLDGLSHIRGNFIGVRSDGVTAFPNTRAVYVAPAGTASEIGMGAASNPADRNLIARGIQISGATQLIVGGNLVGVDASATTLMGGLLGPVGIVITGSAGPNILTGNVVAVGGLGAAIQLSGARNTAVQGNILGVGAGGAALGNAIGVLIDNTAGLSLDNFVSNNIITNSQLNGISVWDQTGGGSIGGNYLASNAIYGNASLGINLRANSEAVFTITPNDANDTDTGPNALQNYPAITTAKANAGGGIDIAFSLNSTPSTSFSITGYANPTCHSSGYGEGRYPDASAIATATTDAAGNASGTLTVPAPLPTGWTVGQVVALLARNTTTNDTSEFSACATVAPSSVAVNQPPVAVNNSYTTPISTTLNVAASGVLANDSDPDGDPISAVLNVGPTHGSLTLNTNGSFSYAPTAGYSGPDSFSYFANDGNTSSASAATVGITVGSAATNQPPVAANDTYATPIGTTLTVPQASGVLANDSDPDGNPITANMPTPPSHGTLSTFTANGNFSYTPLPGYVGPDSFTYTISDGTTNSASATVIINVGTAPAGATPVPTLSEWGLLLLAALMCGAGWWQVQRRGNSRLPTQ